MAWIVSTLQSPGATTGASFTPSNPGTHVANDLLLYCISQDGGATPVSFWTSSVTASAAADTLTYSGSDYWTDGDPITLSGTTAPGGTTKETVRYYVRDLNTGAKTFKIAATAGGFAIDLTTAGSAVVANLMAPGTNHPLSGSGWAMLGNQNDSGQGVRQAWAYKIATGAGSTAPTFYGSNDDWYVTGLVVRDAHATAPFGSAPASGTNWARTDASGSSTTSGALTSPENGCLLLYSWAYDSNNVQYGFCKLSEVWAVDKRTVSAVVTAVIGAYQQAGDGSGAGAAAPTVTYYNSRSGEGGNGWVLAIRNKSGGATQPDIRAATTELRWYGALGALHDATTTWQSPSNLAATINGITCSSTAPTVSTTGTALNSNWQTYAELGSTEVTAGAWVGGTHTISSTDMAGKVFGIEFFRSPGPGSAATTHGADGVIVVFSDGTNWAAYQILTLDKSWISTVTQPGFIALGTATPYATSGSINWAAVTRIGYFWHRTGSSASSGTLAVGRATLFGSTALVGGGAGRPATFADYQAAMASWSSLGWADLQGSAQVLARSSLQIGDGGTTKTYFDAAASSFEYPPAWSNTYVANWQMSWNATAGATALAVKAGSSDTIKLAAGVCATAVQQALTIDAASSTSASYDFTGMSFVGWSPTWKTGVAVSGATFKSCAPVAFKGANVTDCTIKTTTASSSQAAATWDTSAAAVTRTTIDVSGTSAGYHIELGTSVTSITLTDVTFTGTPGTDKIHVKATTGTVTITIDGTTSLADGDVTSDGATVSIVAPTTHRGIAFTGLVAGSLVKVFTTGTTTEQASTLSSGTTFTWDDGTVGSLTVDYVILKAGYDPIRVPGVTVTGSTTALPSTPISQVVDRAYVASSGLTYGTNTSADVASKYLKANVATTVQNFYSHMMEQWIDRAGVGCTAATFANVAFPLRPNGPNSFTLLDGWETRGYTTAGTGISNTTLSYLSRDGLRYVNSSGTRTAVWAALLSVGVPSGGQVRYQQSDGGTTSNAAATGNIDQLIQVYGDASHGNFDRTGYLVAKLQKSGYDQIEADAVTLYGTLEDQLYVVGLAPTANGIATGSPGAVTATITDHGASPVTWHGAAYSITIQSDASGTTLMRWLRYNFETGGTFQGTDAFNWHDLIQTNGDAFKTIRGTIYGDTGASLKGVRVITSGGADHPDFTLYTADDGSTYAPVIPATASATILAGSRVQLYNVTAATEIENVVEATTSYSYTITTEASVGDVLRLRVCKLGYEPQQVFAVRAAGGVTFLVSQSSDPIYTAWGIDGSTVTEFTLDVTGNIEIDANDVDGATTKTRLGAWFNYALTTADGVRYAFGAITALATNAIRINVDVVDLTIENINATTALRFTDTDVRLYRSDGSTIIAATSYSIHNDYSGVPDVVETGVSGLTGSESAQLMGLPSATATAAAVWAHTLP